MAVIANPPVRSTRRRDTLTLDDADRDNHPPTLLGKRPRNASSTNGDYIPSKKQRPEQWPEQRPEQTLPARPKDAVRDDALPTYKQRERDTIAISVTRAPRGGRATSAVQPPATGTIIANSNALAANAKANANANAGARANANASGHFHGGHDGDGNNTAAQQSKRTQEAMPARDGEKRSLRSHDGGSRSRSELALYFPNYEELISNDPREPEPLTAETRIYVSEEAPKSPTAPRTYIHPSTSPTPKRTTPLSTPRKQHKTAPLPTKPTSPTTFSRIDLDALASKISKNDDDLLTAELYHKAHRRAERQEKQLKNIEKERAQHEKIQLERLFDGLRGPDWLRVMGISGITDGERKKWEEKRAWCIKEVGGLLEKFRRWREEERRRRAEKEAAMEEDEDDEDEGSDEEEESSPAAHASPASSDVDAMAAMQLHKETLSASGGKGGKGRGASQKKRARSITTTAAASPPKVKLKLTAPKPPPEQKPMTSFFAKPHERAAALDKNRRSGRKKLAFGHALPELAEQDFELPPGMITEDTVRSNARSRRRARRGTGT